MAVFSTIGGAYHATRKNNTFALQLARQQEKVAMEVGAVSAAIKARIHQALNLGLLGDIKNSRAMIILCKHQARQLKDDKLVEHCVNSYLWLVAELEASGEWKLCGKGKRDQPKIEVA